MLAKKQDDFCLRALAEYTLVAEELYPQVKLGYINVLEDEALKVAFNELAVPYSYGIYGGRAYQYPALERSDHFISYFNDLEQWKKMEIQFDLPAGPASKAEIIWFDVKKDIAKNGKPMLRAYMQWFHTMRTGSPDHF